MYEHREVLLNQEQLEERLRYWQNVLRLNDWRIVVVLCRSRDIDGNDGLCEQLNSLKQAKVSIADPTDWAPTVPLPLDMEWTLVHELLHIVWGVATSHINRSEGGPLVWAMEASIEATTFGLISLDRNRKDDSYAN